MDFVLIVLLKLSATLACVFVIMCVMPSVKQMLDIVFVSESTTIVCVSTYAHPHEFEAFLKCVY